MFFCCFLFSISIHQMPPRNFFPHKSLIPHPLPQARLSLTLIHRQHIAVNDRAGIALDRLVEWLKFCGVLDECDEVDDVLIFV